MKKIIAAFAIVLSANLCHAIEFLNGAVEATLIDHVSPVVQVIDGETRGALLDSIILIGSHKGRSIFDVQAGFSGNTKPEAGQTGVRWLTGGLLKVSTLVRDRLHLADHWKFLNALEYGVAYSYDWTEKRDYVSLQFGLAFSLKPIN